MSMFICMVHRKSTTRETVISNVKREVEEDEEEEEEEEEEEK